jgi:hypothetical protein
LTVEEVRDKLKISKKNLKIAPAVKKEGAKNNNQRVSIWLKNEQVCAPMPKPTSHTSIARKP